MTRYQRIFIISGLICSSFVNGQKATLIQINSLIDRIPVAESSQPCYSICKTETVKDIGIVVVDNGPVFNQLYDELKRIKAEDSARLGHRSAVSENQAAMKKAAQDDQQAQQQAIQQQQMVQQMAAMNQEQMQQAMQNNNNHSSLQKVDGNMMKEIGKAQDALMKISQLINQCNMEFHSLQYTDKDKIPIPAGCGFSCGCEKNRSIESANNFIKAENSDITLVMGVFKKYRPQISEQVAVVDKLESDYNYGEKVTDPNMKQMFWSMQRRAMTGFEDLLGIASGAWNNGANAFCKYMNAKNIKCGND
jgi:hypothetical protein